MSGCTRPKLHPEPPANGDYRAASDPLVLSAKPCTCCDRIVVRSRCEDALPTRNRTTLVGGYLSASGTPYSTSRISSLNVQPKGWVASASPNQKETRAQRSSSSVNDSSMFAACSGAETTIS